MLNTIPVKPLVLLAALCWITPLVAAARKDSRFWELHRTRLAKLTEEAYAKARERNEASIWTAAFSMGWKEDSGVTPLFFAIRNGFAEHVALLLLHGADVNEESLMTMLLKTVTLESTDGHTPGVGTQVMCRMRPLAYAQTMKPSNPVIIELLRARGAR